MALLTWRVAQARAGILASMMEGTCLNAEALLDLLQQQHGQQLETHASCSIDQHSHSASSAHRRLFHRRCLHSSSPGLTADRYMRNLRQQMPKAKVFNRTNYEMWRTSGFDIGMAQQFLAQLEVPAQLQSPRAASRAVRQLIQDATNLPELALAAEQLQAHLEPDSVLALCMKAMSLQDKEITHTPQASGWSHPHSVRASVTSLLQPLVQGLALQLPQLSTSQLSHLLYCIARGKLDASQVEDGVAVELTHHDAYRLSVAEPQVLASMLRSAAHLGWQHDQKHAWASLVSALGPHLQHVEPRLKAQVAEALSRAHDPNSPLWPLLATGESVVALLHSDPAAWASILFSMAMAQKGNQLSAFRQIMHSSVQALTSHASLAQSLPPAALAKAASAMSAALMQQARQQQQPLGIHEPVDPADASLLQNAFMLLLQAATVNILRFSLPELALVLQAVQRSQCGQSQTTTCLLQLAAGVVQSRGLQTPACVAPTLQLITLLAQLTGSSQHVTQSLTHQAVKLLPFLPAGEVADLIDAWSSHASTAAAMQLVSPASAQLLSRCTTASKGQHVPPHMVAPLITALTRLCSLVQACKSVPAARKSQDTARQLASRIADLLQVSASKQGHELSTQQKQEVVRALSLEEVGLQGHPLAQLLA